ncbi:MAG: alpha/beta hydrolase [Chloroflexi bacterium]|nr:alpha/beta hydrolase [Chloroflexota bacterium]
MTTPAGGLSLFDAARAMGVPFTTEVSPSDGEVVVRGFKFHYLDWGNQTRPPMVLLHGRTNAAHTWDFTALAFQDRFHVLSLDMPGHGDTAWSPSADYTLNTTAPLVASFIDALDLKSLYLIGHSMGGRNALVYAAQNPGVVKALVLVDMAPEVSREPASLGWRVLPAETDTFEEFVQAALKVNPRRSPEQLRGSLAHQLRQYPSGKWSWKWDPALREADTNGWGPDRLWPWAEKIRCPTLLARGGDSDLIPDAVVERMRRTLPNFKSVDIPGAAHQVHGDRPALFIQAVRGFLDSLAQ